VIEHVTNPQLAFDEMFRVLKPGGALYVEIAFMQPVHMAPHHYFNVTPHGLKHLLRDWDVLWTDTTGTPEETMDWIFRTYGAQRMRTLSRRPTPEQYAQASCGVSALARKPV
jgi:ubiquinone/menaquinone biosynthesis C-methylase UbiE